MSGGSMRLSSSRILSISLIWFSQWGRYTATRGEKRRCIPKLQIWWNPTLLITQTPAPPLWRMEVAASRSHWPHGCLYMHAIRAVDLIFLIVFKQYKYYILLFMPDTTSDQILWYESKISNIITNLLSVKRPGDLQTAGTTYLLPTHYTWWTTSCSSLFTSFMVLVCVVMLLFFWTFNKTACADPHFLSCVKILTFNFNPLGKF